MKATSLEGKTKKTKINKYEKENVHTIFVDKQKSYINTRLAACTFAHFLLYFFPILYLFFFIFPSSPSHISTSTSVSSVDFLLRHHLIYVFFFFFKKISLLVFFFSFLCSCVHMLYSISFCKEISISSCIGRREQTHKI